MTRCVARSRVDPRQPVERQETRMAIVTTGREIPGFEGQLIGREDPEYDEARKVYNAMIDKRPALIARCAGADDVGRAIAYGRQHALPVAIRGGGHNGAGL